MMRLERTLLYFALLTAPVVALAAPPAADADADAKKTVASSDASSHVRIVKNDGRYRLLVNGAPFYIKGGGMSGGLQDALVAHGGNSFRTWDSNDVTKTRALLDDAKTHGLMVAVGIEVARERHGFDYDDATAVAKQRETIREQILAYRNHPAVLMWVVGNELNLKSTNPAVWNAVGELATMIHAIDPNHPVMTTLAGFDPALIANIKTRASSLDLIGIQMYGNISELPQTLRAAEWTGPYVVTEWGPSGHWENGNTTWGAPIEDDSSRKAELLRQRYDNFIASDRTQGLGSYVFLWGNKQERTPTWYGLFLASGEATPGADVMQSLWTGKWPENRSPSITPITLHDMTARDSIILEPGERTSAHVQSSDPDGDAVTYRWSVRSESNATTTGGDPEAVPSTIPMTMSPDDSGTLRLTTPATPGDYRLFVEVRDGHGHASYANTPFRVEASAVKPAAKL